MDKSDAILIGGLIVLIAITGWFTLTEPYLSVLPPKTNVSDDFVAVVPIELKNCIIESYNISYPYILIVTDRKPFHEETYEIPIKVYVRGDDILLWFGGNAIMGHWPVRINPTVNKSAKVYLSNTNITLYKYVNGTYIGEASINITATGRCSISIKLPSWLCNKYTTVYLTDSKGNTYYLFYGNVNTIYIAKGKYKIVFDVPDVCGPAFILPPEMPKKMNGTAWLIVNGEKWIPIRIKTI